MLGLLAYAADPREADIAAASKSFGNCWNTRDTECLSKLVTDDFVQVVRTGALMDKTAFLEGVKAGRYSRNDPASPSRDEKVRFYGSTAIVTYVRTSPGPSYGGKLERKMLDHYFTMVWVTADGKNWRLASMHASLPSAPLPQ